MMTPTEKRIFEENFQNMSYPFNKFVRNVMDISSEQLKIYSTLPTIIKTNKIDIDLWKSSISLINNYVKEQKKIISKINKYLLDNKYKTKALKDIGVLAEIMAKSDIPHMVPFGNDLKKCSTTMDIMVCFGLYNKQLENQIKQLQAMIQWLEEPDISRFKKEP